MGLKRQRVLDQGSSYYGTPPASSYMYSPSAYSYVNQPPAFPVVRLRGLPFDCSEADIAEFFHGLDIVDMLFVNKHGKFAGEVYCVLGYAFQVEYALQRIYCRVHPDSQVDYALKRILGEDMLKFSEAKSRNITRP